MSSMSAHDDRQIAQPVCADAYAIAPLAPEDLESAAQLFYDTVRSVNSRDYTPDQLDAWAPNDPAHRARLIGKLAAERTLGAKEGNELVGFGSLDDEGHLDMLYVRHDRQGQGAGQQIVRALEHEATNRGWRALRTFASVTARPFFERMGYRTVRPNTAVRNGVPLDNFLMEKQLASPSRPAPSPNKAPHAAPPLDSEEALALGANLFASQALILLVGIVLSIVSVGVASGDRVEATLGWGWAAAVASSITALNAPATTAVACAAAAVFTFAAWMSEQRALKSEAGRASVFAARQGINGELARLPLPVLVPLLALTGFAEELLFRFALIGLTASLIGAALPPIVAGCGALFVSSAAFWFAHVRYRDLASTVLTLALGLLLGIAFMATGSLAVAALAHALYDLAVLLIARARMRRDPNYFNGPAPVRVMLDQLDEERSA